MDFNKIIDQNMEEEIKALQDILRINSEGAEPILTQEEELLPFGRGVHDAFLYMLDLGKSMGFSVENIDNYGGHIDFGHGDETLGMIGHIDVVPAGEGWTFEPYSGEIKDGYIYGRGTTDDKGPVIAALYAMKALKDAGYKPEKKIRLILGLDEETNWKGLDYYLNHAPMPNFGFTPDGEFPVVNGEKGIMTFNIVKKFSGKRMKGLELRKFEGGDAPNMVAESARVLMNTEEEGAYDRLKDEISSYAERTGYEVAGRGMGKSFEITAKGKAAHGAHPDLGLNAISILFDFLGTMNFVDEEVNEFVDFYNKHIGFDLNGERFGCQVSDEVSGKLTVNVGTISYEKKAISMSVNVRFPVTYTSDEIFEGIMPIIDRYRYGVLKTDIQEPIYMEEDSSMVKTFMEVYKKNTGDEDSKPQIMGGGTYARSFENMLAFGGLFPGDPDLMHQRDEKLELSRLETMTKIYAEALYKMTAPDFEI